MLKLNKYNDIFIRSMKNYTKEKLLKLLRKTAFHNCTFTCLNKAYQDFIFKVRLTGNFGQTLKQFQQFVGRINFSKNTKNLVWIKTKNIFGWQKWLRKLYLREKENYFQENVENNANNSTQLWKALRSGKVNQSKMMVLFNLNL